MTDIERPCHKATFRAEAAFAETFGLVAYGPGKTSDDTKNAPTRTAIKLDGFRNLNITVQGSTLVLDFVGTSERAALGKLLRMMGDTLLQFGHTCNFQQSWTMEGDIWSQPDHNS